MPEPAIKDPNIPNTQTATQGLADPNFAKALDEAFAKVQAADNPPVATITPTDAPAPAPKPPELSPARADDAPPVAKDEPHDAEPVTSTAKANWKELKRLKQEAEEAAEAAKTRVKDLESRLSKYNDEDITRVRKERDDFEQRLKAFAVEHDPQFNAEFTNGIERIKREAEVTLGDRANRFLSLLALPEGDFKRQQLAAVTEDMDEFAKQDAYSLMREHRKLATDRAIKIEEAKNNYEKLSALQRQRMQEQQDRLMQRFDQILNQWQDPQAGIPALQVRDDAPEHNQMVQEAVKRARDIFSGTLTPDEMIKASLWSAAAPNLLANLNTLSTENAKLREEVKKLRAVEPGFDSAGSGEAGEVAEADDQALSKMGYADAMVHLMRKQGVFR